MTRSRVALLALLLVGVVALSACAPGPNNVATVNAPHIAGFWLGLWHGIICPVTFLISLFNDNVNIYEGPQQRQLVQLRLHVRCQHRLRGGSRASAR